MAQYSNKEVMNGFYKLVEKMFRDAQRQVLLANQFTQFRCGHGIFPSLWRMQQLGQCQCISGG